MFFADVAARGDGGLQTRFGESIAAGLGRQPVMSTTPRWELHWLGAEPGPMPPGRRCRDARSSHTRPSSRRHRLAQAIVRPAGSASSWPRREK